MNRFVCFLLALSLAPLAANGQSGPRPVISRVMADPSSLPDAVGEWIEITNAGDGALDLRNWKIGSGRDPGFTITGALVVRPHTAVILGRSLQAAPKVDLVYSGINLANGADWVTLVNPRGETVDSLAWARAPRGQPVERAVAVSSPLPPPSSLSEQSAKREVERVPAPADAATAVTVRILDVGQGDALLIQNGGSNVLVDGGPDPSALGRHLDALELNGDTISAVVLTHAHADHYQGLRELFATRRHITVRYFWENQDPSPNVTLGRLRDSIAARVRAGSLTYRDTDDPCANRTPICTVTLRGGAKLHIMRPDPDARNANDRSPAIKLVGPDSASFTMWMAGDAEHDDMDWFRRSGYDRNPGMHVDVLKADHHGSCNGVSDWYLDQIRPSLAVVSLGAINDYGHMHIQAKALYSRHGVPWYRTDQNGTITIRSAGTPGSGYSVTVEQGDRNASGPSDRKANPRGCS